MPTERPKYWFKRRRYGWGWIPVTWHGWLVVAAWLAVVVFGIPALLDAPVGSAYQETGAYYLTVILATAGLIRIGYAKGPLPRWRWGKSSDDNPAEDF